VFSALTASIDGEMAFEAVQDDAGHTNRLGVLSIAMDARFLINDGQHRRAAIEDAMAIDPTLMEETIPIVIFGDEGLSRSQQMFADLNRHAIRPAKSIGVLYDHRDDESAVVRLVVLKSAFFRGVVETEKSNLSPRSGKLFTLSALYNATLSLFAGLDIDSIDTAAALARTYWEEVARHFPEWQQVSDRSVSAGEIRTEYLHSHGIVLHALGKVGNVLLKQSREKDDWVPSLQKLDGIDWRRSNSKTWEGRAMIGGRVSKATNNVVLTTNLIKTELGIALTPDEQRAEDNYLEGAR
jgi:DNA sulfur modification protein DndB